MVALLQFGIPIFFYISGLVSKVYDCEKKGFLLFFKNKFKRLMIPFFYSVLLFLIPRLYLAQNDQAFTRVDGKINWNFFSYTWSLLPVLLLKLSWLWFLPAIWIISLITYPLLAFSQRRKKMLPFDYIEDGKIIIGQFIMMAIWSIPNFILPPETGMKYLMPMSLTFIVGFAMMYA